MDQKIAVLFGGSGFIGSYLATELISQNIVDKVVLADLAVDQTNWSEELIGLTKQGKVTTAIVDVREPINASVLPEKVELVVNLAAIHREPGHKEHEYFETNLPGAENICNWASFVGAQNLIFTSSIAVYGASEYGQITLKDEQTLPMPNTPYGISKLVAEKIHLKWQAEDNSRKLLIVRPGVIFGGGEKGNVTRMVRAMLNGYFVFAGNKETRKAGGYVKELCSSLVWMFQQQIQKNIPVQLFNFSMEPTPTMSEYADSINKTVNKNRYVPEIPLSLLIIASKGYEMLLKVLGKKTDINPVRVRKAVRSNYIAPTVLKEMGYKYKYSLDQAMADWKKNYPKDWEV